MAGERQVRQSCVARPPAPERGLYQNVPFATCYDWAEVISPNHPVAHKTGVCFGNVVMWLVRAVFIVFFVGTLSLLFVRDILPLVKTAL